MCRRIKQRAGGLNQRGSRDGPQEGALAYKRISCVPRASGGLGRAGQVLRRHGGVETLVSVRGQRGEEGRHPEAGIFSSLSEQPGPEQPKRGIRPAALCRVPAPPSVLRWRAWALLVTGPELLVCPQ